MVIISLCIKDTKWRRSKDGIVHKRANRANVASIYVPVQSHFSLFSPTASPWIFDDIIVGSVGKWVDCDDLDTMIESIAASTVIQYAWTVKLPVFVSSIKRYNDWSYFEQASQSRATVSVECIIWPDEIGVTISCLACWSLSCVWVAWFEIHSLFYDVLKTVKIEARRAQTIAVWGRTINDLLFWEVIELSVCYQKGWLYVSNGGEGITTRAARSLVLYGTYLAIIPPIHHKRAWNCDGCSDWWRTIDRD